jgi:hypothetical protein
VDCDALTAMRFFIFYKHLLFPFVLFFILNFLELFFMHRKIERSYKELEARKNRVSQLEKVYMDMAMKKELQVLIF